MNSVRWLSIKYRDFHDVPRVFVVEYESDAFLFDSEFDPEVDEYSSSYAVYRLANASINEIDSVGDWRQLPKMGVRIATVKVTDVKFDHTARQFVDGSIFCRFD